MGERTWSDKALREAVKTSHTIAEVKRKLGLYNNSSYRTIKTNCARLGLDTSHFTGQAWAKGKKIPPKKPLEEYLVRGSTVRNQTLVRRLVEEELLPYQCSECGVQDWRGKPLTLQLEHKNGDNTDNRLENLTILCPNCHAQTETYCKGKWRPPLCIDCRAKVVFKRGNRCKSCEGKRRGPEREKADWPKIDTLQKMVQETSYSAVGRKLGVSDNAVRKRLRNHGGVV